MLDHPYNSHLKSLWLVLLFAEGKSRKHRQSVIWCHTAAVFQGTSDSPWNSVLHPSVMSGFFPQTMILSNHSLGAVHYSVELLCSLLFTLFCLHVVGYSLFLPKYSNLHLAYIFFQTRCPFANIILILFLSTVGTAASLLLFGIVKIISADNPVTAETAG